MSQHRQAWLLAQYDAALARAGPSASPMSVLGALCVSELSVSGGDITAVSRDCDHGDVLIRRGLVHATDEVAAKLENLQLTVGEGPCLETFTADTPVLIDDLIQVTGRWSAFIAEARTLGVAAVFSFPLQTRAGPLGVLGCYRCTPGPLSQTAAADALILAELATRTILAELDSHVTDDPSWLADAHDEIHQASGLVGVQLESSCESALLRLRAHAYTHKLALADVAHQVLARDLRFDTDPDGLN